MKNKYDIKKNGVKEMTFNKEDVLIQEQIEEISQIYQTEEEQARQILKIKISPEQMWIFYRKFRSFQIFNYVRESDMFNLMSDYVDGMDFLPEEIRDEVIDSRIDLLLAVYRDKQIIGAKEAKEKKKQPTDTISELEDLSDTDHINIEDAVAALRIERLGERFSQLDSIEESNKRCSRAIAICEELIEAYKERISSNNEKKELLKSRKDETKRR